MFVTDIIVIDSRSSTGSKVNHRSDSHMDGCLSVHSFVPVVY